MPLPTPENTQSPDGLFIGGILAGSIFLLSFLAGASLIATISVFTLAAACLWAYLYVRRPNSTSRTRSRANHDLVDLRETVLEEVADALPCAIAVLNTSGDVLHANAKARAMLAPDMIGRPIDAFLRTSAVQPNLERAFNGEIPPSFSVHVLQPKERYIDVNFSQAVSIAPDHANGAVIFAVLEDRTHATKDREQRADFLANASHELKTPIASLKGYIETLRGHAKDDPVAREKFLGIMGEQAERMERLVTDLLSLRRIESIEHIAPSETADLRKAIEAARDALEVLSETRGVTLVVSLPKMKAATTSGKTDECVQLFLNLMENAIKLSPQGAIVRIGLDYLPVWSGDAFPPPLPTGSGFRRIVNLAPSGAPAWRVVISDEGPGFSNTHLPRIGERFYRVAGDLPAQEKGTGLGLAIVKHIIMRHRAGLYVKSIHAGAENAPKSGTSFSVIFKSTEPTP